MRGSWAASSRDQVVAPPISPGCGWVLRLIALVSISARSAESMVAARPQGQGVAVVWLGSEAAAGLQYFDNAPMETPMGPWREGWDQMGGAVKTGQDVLSVPSPTFSTPTSKSIRTFASQSCSAPWSRHCLSSSSSNASRHQGRRHARGQGSPRFRALREIHALA